MSDLNLYYRDTVNKYRNKLVKILGSTKDRLLARTLDEDEEELLIPPSSLTVLNNIKLGYVNTPVGAIYMERSPVRCPKEGLCEDNVISIPYKGDIITKYTKEFKRMLNNDYPSFLEASELAEKTKKIVAYCKEEAVDYCGNLYRCGIPFKPCKKRMKYV